MLGPDLRLGRRLVGVRSSQVVQQRATERVPVAERERGVVVDGERRVGIERRRGRVHVGRAERHAHECGRVSQRRDLDSSLGAARSCTSAVPSTRTRSWSPNTGVPKPRGVGRRPMCVVAWKYAADTTCSASACNASSVAERRRQLGQHRSEPLGEQPRARGACRPARCGRRLPRPRRRRSAGAAPRRRRRRRRPATGCRAPT